MAERPIIFSTPMVQEIINNTKTMTRRIVRPQPNTIEKDSRDRKPLAFWVNNFEWMKPPYQPGDILWVRETWAKISDWTIVDPEVGLPDGYIYKADWGCGVEHPRWRPNIHMPKEAARLFLEVAEIRVERLQEILCGDMMAEGVIPKTVTGGQWQQWQHEYFKPLWDSIYSKRGFGWEQNPWVWVIKFKRLGGER